MLRSCWGTILKELVLGGLLSLVSCGSQPPTPTPVPTQSVVSTCTVEGCGNGLEVVFSGAAPNDYTLVATPGDGEALSVRCLDGAGQYPEDYFPRDSYALCTVEGVMFLHFSPEAVTLTVTWDDRTATQAFEPNYEIDYPNGPDC